MTELQSNSKRLAKNTVLLYMRTFFVMIIGLFTSRVILQTLGVEDYGTYTIVGGFVSFFSIISGTLVSTTQRFITFELGKGDGANTQKVFGAAMAIHVALAIILLILFETIGLWFLNCKLNIPGERLYAANWVFQFSILSFLVNIISTPYTAVIIAHERMKAFAYISIMDVILRLVIVYALYLTPFDKLITYSILLFGVAFLDRMIYNIYCKINFKETKVVLVKDKGLYKSMFSFAGMNFIGSFASILSGQGTDIIINLFFGVTVNAARGISNQVLHAVTRFVNDFMTALNPQITKEYAAGNKKKSKELCFQGSKYSFFLMLFFAVPVVFRAPQILSLWLGNYPDYSVIFVRCAFILSMLTVLSGTLITEILATGNLTSTTWWIGGTRLITLPLVYLCYSLGGGPEFAYFSLIFIEIVSLFLRLFILERITDVKFVKDFTIVVFFRAVIVTLISGCIVFIVNRLFPDTTMGLLEFLVVAVFIVGVVIYVIGISADERRAVLSIAKKRIINKRAK